MTMWDYLKCFAFKNFNAIVLEIGLLWVLINVPAMHDTCTVLLTLIVKYFFDTSISSANKDETISSALTAAQQTPAVPVGA